MQQRIKNRPENGTSSLGDLFLIFRRTLMEGMKKEGLTDDLTFPQIEVLRFIGPRGVRTMKGISLHLKIAPPSATALIAELEKKGLVRHIQRTGDRRVVAVAFTGKAKKLFASLSRRKEVVFKKMFSKLSAEDRKNLERIIRILIAE